MGLLSIGKCFGRLALVLLVGLHALAAQSAEDFLPPEQAFAVSARAASGGRIEVVFDIAPGYYLYRERLRFEKLSGVPFETVSLPAGHTKFDENFQKQVETYRDRLIVSLGAGAGEAIRALKVTSQGCADKGLCYPPQTQRVDVTSLGTAGAGSSSGQTIAPIDSPKNQISQFFTANRPPQVGVDTKVESRSGTSIEPSPSGSTQTSLPIGADVQTDSTLSTDAVLRGEAIWKVVAVFFVAGLLLSLTPCVLPMLPILVSIIVGQGAAASRKRALGLAVCYSLGMALVYTALGIAAGLAGEGLAAWLQKPIVLAGFATLLAALSLSMFGVYNLQVPEVIAGRLTQTTQRLPGGRWLAVFAMGAVSALIVSPCVAAPLAGALVYISQTRDVLIGGTALFALACGMGVPLVVVGTSAGKLIPKAGAWMEDIKFFFGLVLLGMALWTVQILLPGPLVLTLWGALAFAGVVRLVRNVGGLSRSAVAWRRAGALALAFVALGQWLGAAAGGSDPLKPWAAYQSQSAPLSFAPIHSVQDLSQALARGAAIGRPTLLDFYADWCVSCKEMDRYTYTDPQVRQKLAGVNLLKADVTANDEGQRALLRQFGLFGPPGTLLFDAQGQEIRPARIVGYEDAKTFLASLKRAGW